MSVESRLVAVEARQRAYKMHDPECPVFKTEVAQRRTDAYLFPPDCECWLSE